MVQATKPKTVYSAKPLTGYHIKGYRNLVLVSPSEVQHQVDTLEAGGFSFTEAQCAQAISVLGFTPSQFSLEEYNKMSVAAFLNKRSL
jgi:hypothetical protein